ncbi:hypothetical protein GCM10009670_23920 [Citricoccus alkalitolerans]
MAGSLAGRHEKGTVPLIATNIVGNPARMRLRSKPDAVVIRITPLRLDSSALLPREWCPLHPAPEEEESVGAWQHV